MLEKSISPTPFVQLNRREKGQSLLELAFAMIFLLVLLAGKCSTKTTPLNWSDSR